MKIPTFVPKALWKDLRHLWSASIVDVLWWSLVTALLVVFAYGLVAMGVVGAVIAFVLVSSLISDRVRDIVWDLLNRRFKTIRV